MKNWIRLFAVALLLTLLLPACTPQSPTAAPTLVQPTVAVQASPARTLIPMPVASPTSIPTGTPPPTSTPTTPAWQPMPVEGAPSARFNFNAVWTGNEMIVWGGTDTSNNLQMNGAIFDPAAGTWKPLSTQGAPATPGYDAAVWTGSESGGQGKMIVWGWGSMSETQGDGGVYDPAAGEWTKMSLAGSPTGRITSAVWTGKEMIFWGGYRGGIMMGDGGRYDPALDKWTVLPAQNAPSQRNPDALIWTGKELLVWSGEGPNSSILSDGAAYDPAADAWTPIPTDGAPSPRILSEQLWTGKELLVWGGKGKVGQAYQDLDDGYGYNPETKTWTRLLPFSQVTALYKYEVVWTGADMIVAGEKNENGKFLPALVVGRYDPFTGEWTDLPTKDAPAARTAFSMTWAGGTGQGGTLIIWGGEVSRGNALDDGYTLTIP